MYKLDWPWTGTGEWFKPETQSLTLSERDSTSSITICPGPGVPEIGFNDWLLQEDGPEGPIVWRVKSIDDSVNTQTVTIELEHVIKYLQDKCFFTEATTAMIAGTTGATTCTAKQAVEYILAQQGAWVLGDFEFSISNPYEFDGDTLYDALETVTDTLEDSIWEYDMSVYPFKLHIRQRDNTVLCEMRGARNLTTLRKAVNRSGMYTRLYPIGKNDLHITGEYISENEGLYGRIDKIETDQSKSTEANLLSWARGRLRRHCEPTVSISISGLELEIETGETMDRLRLNKVCRVPLPEYGTTITEPIIKKNWKDWISDKISVTVTLSNSTEDVTTIIKNQSKTSGKAAKGNAKQNYLFEANGEHLYYEVFDDCGHLHGLLNMTSESLRIAFDNEISSTRSEFQMTSESLRISFENEISSTRSEFQMTSESLRIQFENDIASTRSEFQMTSESLRIAFDNEISSTRSEFQMTSESLRIQFENDIASTRSEFQMTSESLRIAFENEITSTRSEIQQTADLVGMIVEGTGSNAHIKPAKIQASINAATGTSKILLSADNVVIDGELITGALEGEDVVCDSVETGGLVVGGTCTFDINAPIVGGDGGTDDYNWGDVIVNAELLTDNKTLRLTRLDGSTLDFSKATTLSPSWSSGAFPLTVNATQINNGVATNVGAKTIGFTNAADVYLTVEKNGNPTSFGNSKKLINVPFKIVHHAGGTVGDQDRYASSLASVDATSVYNNGWDDVVLNDPDWQYPTANHNSDNTTAANSVVIAASNKTDGTTRSKTIPIALTVDTTNKKAKVSAGGYVRAIANIDMKTNAEYNTAVANAGYAGRAAVTIDSTLTWGTRPASDISVSQNSFTVKTAGRTNSSGTIQQDEETFNLYSQVSTSGLNATFYVTIGDSANGSRVIKRTATCSYVPNYYNADSFDTVSAETSVQVNGHYNNSDGYYISSNSRNADVQINVKGTWTHGGGSETHYSWIAAAAGRLYRRGFDNGEASASASHAITSFDTTAASTSETYNNLTNNSDGYVISGTGPNANAFIVTKSTWKCDGQNKSALSYLGGATTRLYNEAFMRGWANYYDDPDWWEAPSSSNGNKCYIPNRSRTGKTLWFTVSSSGSNYTSLGSGWYYTVTPLSNGKYKHSFVLEMASNSYKGLSDGTNYTLYK